MNFSVLATGCGKINIWNTVNSWSCYTNFSRIPRIPSRKSTDLPTDQTDQTTVLKMLKEQMILVQIRIHLNHRIHSKVAWLLLFFFDSLRCYCAWNTIHQYSKGIPFPRDPGSPKLRMVSWNLNDLCVSVSVMKDTPTAHQLRIWRGRCLGICPLEHWPPILEAFCSIPTPRITNRRWFTEYLFWIFTPKRRGKNMLAFFDHTDRYILYI